MTGREIDPKLLAIVVCPDCHGHLTPTPAADELAADELGCDDCGLGYPIKDGIPVLLVDEARKP